MRLTLSKIVSCITNALVRFDFFGRKKIAEPAVEYESSIRRKGCNARTQFKIISQNKRTQTPKRWRACEANEKNDPVPGPTTGASESAAFITDSRVLRPGQARPTVGLTRAGAATAAGIGAKNVEVVLLVCRKYHG